MLSKLTLLPLGLLVSLVTAESSSFNKDAVLARFNSYRAAHSAPALDWSSTLATTAQAYAETCEFTPYNAPAGAFGQIIMHGPAWPAVEMVDYMYDCGFLYDYSNPGPSDSTDSFTQVVWKSTSELGCGWSSCKSTQDSSPLDTLVCFFKTPGNIDGEYAQNVLPPKGQKDKRDFDLVVADNSKMIVAPRQAISRIVR